MFYQFRSDLARSFVMYIGPRIQTPPFVYIHYPIIFGSDIDSYITLFIIPFGHIGTVYQNFALLDHLVSSSIIVLVWLFPDHTAYLDVSYLEPTAEGFGFQASWPSFPTFY